MIWGNYGIDGSGWKNRIQQLYLLLKLKIDLIDLISNWSKHKLLLSKHVDNWLIIELQI